MKKGTVKILACLTILSSAIVGVGAQSKSVELKRGIHSAETGSVGVSKKAEAKVTHYSDSDNPAFIYIYAAWTGWPYTREFSSSTHPGTPFSRVEKQSQDSTFYLELENHPGKVTAHAKGTISTQ